MYSLMENHFFETPVKIKKKHMNKLLKKAKIMITQQAIYWIMNFFQNIID